ncbi:YtxH domain-containing protein [Bacillus sp. PS06]|nr:YtxH domain-containing protein [Bacillus sp. PS06]
MMKNRLILCLLICGLLLYYGIPNLSIEAPGLQGIFSMAWLGFALIVVGGNLVGLLYSPKKRKQVVGTRKDMSQKGRRIRQYQ